MVRFRYLFLIVALLISVCVVSADGGMMMRYQSDLWSLGQENSQLCAINYDNGIQKMILTVTTPDDSFASEALWIFPVPGQPENIEIGIVESYPNPMFGEDLFKRAQDNIENVFLAVRATQIYTWPFIWFRSMSDGSRIDANFNQGLAIHNSITKEGLTTELVSAKSSDALKKYIEGFGATIPPEFESTLSEYINEDYTFVISHVSDFGIFMEQQRITRENSYGYDSKNTQLGVFISFPTQEIFFPMKPTAVYGNHEINTIIHVFDYVEPKIFEDIKEYTKIKYNYGGAVTVTDDLIPFFSGKEIIEDDNSKYLQNIHVTRISIDAPATAFTEDLWMKPTEPASIGVAKFFSSFDQTLLFLIILIITACVSSYFSSLIVYRKSSIKKWKFLLVGLGNILTLIGVCIITYFLRTKKVEHTEKKLIDTHSEKLFKSSGFKRHATIWYSILAFFVIILLSAFIFEYLIFLLFIPLIFGMFILAFYLSHEEFNDKKLHKTLSVLNLKKIIFMLGFNFIGSASLLALSEQINFGSILNKIFDTYINEEIIFFLVILFIYIISIMLMQIVSNLWKDKGYYVVKKDSKKLLFIIVYCLIFLLIGGIFELFLRLLVG